MRRCLQRHSLFFCTGNFCRQNGLQVVNSNSNGRSRNCRPTGGTRLKDLRLTEMEGRFAELIWDHEPIPSGNLVKLCESELNWKKSTTYTMLKRLEAKEIFKNDNGVVGSLIKKDDFYAEQSKAFVKETFGGSLPKFLAAFTKSRKLSDSEIDDVLRLIHEHKEE